MIKKLFLAIICLTISYSSYSQSITFESPTLTQALIGNVIKIDYKYTYASPGNIYCGINLLNDWTYVSFLGGAGTPVAAGTDVTGSLYITIPDSTTLTADLTGLHNYKINIELQNSSFGWVAGSYPSAQINMTKTTDWTGAIDNDWSKMGNWSVDVPNRLSTVSIPASKDVAIYASVGANVDNLTIDPTSTFTIYGGGSLLPTNTVTGNIMYNVYVPDTNWHLVASPLIGAQYDNTWVTNNDIASGSISASNKGISLYNNNAPNPTTGQWSYFQGGTSETFQSGVGYGLKKGTSGGNFAFTGTMPTVLNPSISQNDNNWNLVGNSFPSYMDVSAFITSNGTSGLNQLSDAFQAIYVWDSANANYVALTTGYIHPGQAFFVNSKVNPGTVSITKAMQSHQVSLPFYKSSSPTLNLSVSNATSSKKIQINYFDDKTKGLDPGFDIGMFDGVASDFSLYTHLPENNEGIAFVNQALPTSEIESTIIPIGLKANAGQELTFSLEAINLPSEVQVYLEDRASKTFTSLNNNNVNIVLNESVNGTGKYFLHLSSKSLNVDSNILEGVSVYFSDNSNLRVKGLSNTNASLKLFNLLGKQILNTSFVSNGVKDISLPKLSKGIYIVQVASENGTLNKKIILE